MTQTRKQHTINKHQVWLKHYLDEHGGSFLDGFRSAKKAGYAGTDIVLRAVGSNNCKRYKAELDKWMDEEGLTKCRIKAKIVSLMEAKETKFFAHNGKVTDEREVEAHGIQGKMAELGAKVKGLLAPQRFEHSLSGDDIKKILSAFPEEFQAKVLAKFREMT